MVQRKEGFCRERSEVPNRLIGRMPKT